MSNNTTENQDGFSAEAVYPFYNKIDSKDKSVTVTDPAEGSGGPVDLSINLVLDDSLTEVLEYGNTFVEIEHEGETTVTEATCLKLKFTPEAELGPGILCVLNETMKVLPYPEVPAVLVVNKSGELEWLEVPVCEKGDDFTLGIYNGDWYWYHVEACDCK